MALRRHADGFTKILCLWQGWRTVRPANDIAGRWEVRMTPEGYREMANALWKANSAETIATAEKLGAKHQSPPAAPILIASLAALLADLQKISFLQGAIAALYNVERIMREETLQ